MGMKPTPAGCDSSAQTAGAAPPLAPVLALLLIDLSYFFRNFLKNKAGAGAPARERYRLSISVPWGINGHMHASEIGTESPHRRHNTTNLPKTHQVHTCIHSHMRPSPKNHNLVPP